jgi:hypothetical protein
MKKIKRRVGHLNKHEAMEQITKDLKKMFFNVAKVLNKKPVDDCSWLHIVDEDTIVFATEETLIGNFLRGRTDVQVCLSDYMVYVSDKKEIYETFGILT